MSLLINYIKTFSEPDITFEYLPFANQIIADTIVASALSITELESAIKREGKFLPITMWIFSIPCWDISWNLVVNLLASPDKCWN